MGAGAHARQRRALGALRRPRARRRVPGCTSATSAVAAVRHRAGQVQHGRRRLPLRRPRHRADVLEQDLRLRAVLEPELRRRRRDLGRHAASRARAATTRRSRRARRRPAAPSRAGYPNVVYVCTNGPAPTFVVGPARMCLQVARRRRDVERRRRAGGALAARARLPALPGAAASSAATARVYLPLNCGCGQRRASCGRDQPRRGADVETTPRCRPATPATAPGLIGGVSLGVDDAGNAVRRLAGHRQQGVPRGVARTRARHGTGRSMVERARRDAGRAPTPQVAAREPGHIAIAYYGYTGSDSKRLNGYLTESFDATDADPIFYTAPVNDPAQPLYFPVKPGSLPRNDYLGVTIGPDGTPWTALRQAALGHARRAGLHPVDRLRRAARRLSRRCRTSPSARSPRPRSSSRGTTPPSPPPCGISAPERPRTSSSGSRSTARRWAASGRSAAWLQAETATITSDAWAAVAGKHTVKAVADPAGILAESSDANNAASTQASVARSKQPVYGPGCDASRPAVAHRAGGAVVSGAPKEIPCGTETGYYTGETGISVTPTGTAWFSAADWEWALVRGADKGAHVARVTSFPGRRRSRAAASGSARSRRAATPRAALQHGRRRVRARRPRHRPRRSGARRTATRSARA